MGSRVVTEADIIAWVKKSLAKEDITSLDVQVFGKKGNDDGYSGEVVFVTASGTTENNQKRVLELVVKHGKSNPHLRQVTPVRHIFETEIHVYENIIPILIRFQSEKNIPRVDGFDSMPKCYSTLVLEEMEVLVLENLIKQGYQLHDRMKPLNLQHIKLILSEYGKLHALSFAFRDQRCDEFNSLINEKYGHGFEEFFKDVNIKDTLDKNVEDAVKLLGERGDDSLQKKLEAVREKSVVDTIMDLDKEEEPQSVILHGDCWNNNFLFKYEDENTESPSGVRILDWQISALRSPIFDLSYVIYANSSEEELEHFDELLETYYTSFSNFVRKLGSNPDELFTFEDVKRHWRKYSLFGALFMPTLLKFALCDRAKAQDWDVLKEDDNMGTFFLPEVGDMDSYYKRLKAVCKHYFQHAL